MEKEIGSKDAGGVGTQHEEFVREPARPSKGYKFKRHCARRWWWYLIGFVLLLVVLVIIIIFAVIPKVAQKGFDKTSLTLDSIKIMEPQPDRFNISVESHIHGSSKLAHGKKIDAMTVKFYLDGGEPFMYLPLDDLRGSHSIPVLKDNYLVEIPDKTAFVKFASTLMGTVEFGMNIFGRTKIHLGSIVPKVKYREHVKVTGFNSLKGMEIVKYDPVPGEYTIVGKVKIPNPTIFSLQVGTISIDIKMNGNSIGNGVIPDLTITPGLDNQYDFKGNLSARNVLNLGAAVRAGPVTLQVRATSVRYKEKDIPWLMVPLSAHDIDVPINVPHA